jgi:hypothetical protein
VTIVDEEPLSPLALSPGYSFKTAPCYRGCHNSDCRYTSENQRNVGYLGGAGERCTRVARVEFSKLGARSGPRTRSVHSVPSRSNVLQIGKAANKSFVVF